MSGSERKPSNFLADIIQDDLSAGRNGGRVVTRFPPEPNGFLHIGHAKSILLNFGLSRAFGGRTHLRFDDTNPVTEETEYVEAIQGDVRWLGGEWGQHLYYASDFFERMYECAERLVKEGHAYVDTQAQDAIREQRGSFEKPGTNSPFRDRPVGESLDLFRRMRSGEFQDGEMVLRAKIDMAHPNVLMRNPLLYRIRHAHHHRTGDRWCIYPMYDYAHPLEDAFEGVTHSICTLEFESNRELYDWVLDRLGPWDPRPHQYEFARLALGYTVMSKRKLLQLVNEQRVSGWDDPRMPTVAGMRRRGVTPEALRDFAELIGVAKNNSLVDIGKLEYAIRQDLEGRTPRALAVIDPLPVTIENWPAGKIDELDVPWWPAEPSRGGSRKVPFGRELLVEREDFAEEPPKDWKRLAPGREVRLASAHVIRCEGVEKGADGRPARLRCTLVEGGAERKGLGAVHWVEASRAVAAEVRLFDRLFTVEQPDAEANFLDVLNPGSLVIAKGARVEPALAAAEAGSRWQFLRQGYFFADPVDSRPGAPVFNRTITLKDTWAAKQAEPSSAPQRPTSGKRPSEAPAAPVKSRAELRAEAHEKDGALSARWTRLRAIGLNEEESDVVAADAAVSLWYEGAFASGPAHCRALARWLSNDLLVLAKGRPLATLPLSQPMFNRFVQLVESGRVTPAAGKTLLAKLVEQGGDPEKLARELGLEKVSDRAALAAAVDKAVAAHPAEFARLKGGEQKLLGVLLGAAMREAGKAADAAEVRKILEERLR
ncbi:MAG: glutamine--tRNA ligase/YqeY domain fusion protein [Anaeromyxobacteraceae bacterium]